MDLIIYVLVGVTAIAMIFEVVKRSRTSKPAQGSPAESGPYISADEADPTQTGRIRALDIKKAIRGEEVAAKTATGLKRPGKTNKGAHRSIDHEKVESTDTGGFELPDPFTIDIAEETKE